MDYSDPGQVVEFTSSGRLLWRMGGFNQPSLALPLPNGDILLNDDYNHRVCVVDPATDRNHDAAALPGHLPLERTRLSVRSRKVCPFIGA